MCNYQPAEQQKQARKLHHAFLKNEKTERQEAASYEGEASNMTNAELPDRRSYPTDNSTITKMTAGRGQNIDFLKNKQKKRWYALSS